MLGLLTAHDGAVEKASFVIPAKAGIQNRRAKPWIPAFAGMTQRHTGAYLRLFQQPHDTLFKRHEHTNHEHTIPKFRLAVVRADSAVRRVRLPDRVRGAGG
jgi:hypothetical protein